ncbi:hypothetical protein BT96DRAFT_1019886 [Gymnopus androsaceus JB14]|uniref:CHAT domain-containing protein n=1 Tax=Gymnopus androsaceus JB14 TaxID=1447944 RepID=A0A6A4HMS2_9AGAR|nr:hypothetical protein BT96DRAFT_1019886 [Gymnopus androsaceus JB14]
MLYELGNELQTRFNRMGDMQDLNKCVVNMQQAVDLVPDNYPHKVVMLTDLGNAIVYRFKRLGDIQDLNDAVVKIQQAVHSTPNNHPDKARMLNNLGTTLQNRFHRQDDINDLNDAVNYMQQSLDLTPDNHPSKAIRLDSLGNTLLLQFGRLGNILDLNEAIVKKKQAVDLTLDGHPHKARMLFNLGIALQSQFRRLGDIHDINEAVAKMQQAIDLTNNDHPDRTTMLITLGSALRMRFDRLGALRDLNDAVVVIQQAVILMPDDHSDKARVLNELGNALDSRFNRLGDIEDLNNALVNMQQAVDLTPDDDYLDKADRLTSLGIALKNRFDRLADIRDLNDAISKKKQAVYLTPDDHPNKVIMLRNLGMAFRTRFERLGDVRDLNEAVIKIQQAVKLTADDHPDMAGMLSTLGNTLSSRFQRLGFMQDLNEVVANMKQAVNLMPNVHPDKALMLTNLSVSLAKRFDKLGDIQDLNEAEIKMKEAANLIPDDHPLKAHYLYTLGLTLKTRFEKLGNVEDINAAVANIQQSVGLTPGNHSDQAARLLNLGKTLVVQAHTAPQSNSNSVATCALSYLSAAACVPVGHIGIKFEAAYRWADLALEINDPSIFNAYTTAIHLISQLAWPANLIEDRHFEIMDVKSLISNAAVWAIQSGQCALAAEWFEQGCSVIWAQLLQLRTSFEELKKKYPKHDNELKTLEKLWYITNSPSTEKDFHELAEQRERLIAEIPELKYLLLPKPFTELSKAARHGPVIMLVVNSEQAHALVLLPGLADDSVHIALPHVNDEKLQDLYFVLNKVIQGSSPDLRALDELSYRLKIKISPNQSQNATNLFQRILFILWETVAKPIIEKLRLTTQKLTRIWWCSTGSFSFLPIHAAGDYSLNAEPGSKLADYVISSYTPSVTGLLQAQNSVPDVSGELKMFAISQPYADGQPAISGVEQEVKHIQEHAGKFVSIETLIGDAVTLEKVKEKMKSHDWAHFACHGTQDSNKPLESALLLGGSAKLTINDIISLKLPPKGLAFLSACQTATGDEKLSAEAVHLAAGMLSAGYCSVIGTMWSISDSHAPQVADNVYRYLFQDGKNDVNQSAEALHYAVQSLQKDGNASYATWVPFIHVGV